MKRIENFTLRVFVLFVYLEFPLTFVSYIRFMKVHKSFVNFGLDRLPSFHAAFSTFFLCGHTDEQLFLDLSR